MNPFSFEEVTIKKIYHPLFTEKNVEVDTLRLDKIHPVISGNKWFKLKYYLQDALAQSKKTIVTFGGAYSNHIIATACASKLSGLKSIGIIRGEKPAHLSYTLQEAIEYGMQLIFIGRDDYRNKILPQEVLNNLTEKEIYLINEGGYGEKGAAGITDMLAHYNTDTYTHICCAPGTGTTMAGLIKGALLNQTIIGCSVLKNNASLQDGVRNLLNAEENNRKFIFLHDYHFGGYAKYTPELIGFMNKLYHETEIPTDFVYTAKLFFAINDLVRKNYFDKGSKLLVIHSGGLQGNASLPGGTLIF